MALRQRSVGVAWRRLERLCENRARRVSRTAHRIGARCRTPRAKLPLGWVDGCVSYLIHLLRDDSGDICLQEVVCSVAGYCCQGEDIGTVAPGFAR